MRPFRQLSMFSLALAAAACVLAASAIMPSPRAAAMPKIKHVFVLVLENKNYAETFDRDGDAPYLARRLTRAGVKLPNYYATGHLSLDNYISMVSGQGPNIQTQADCQVFTEFVPGTPTVNGQFIGQGCVYPATVPTIADQLEAAGLSWRGYMQHMARGEPKSCRHPAIGAVDDSQSAEVGDQYATRHNPFVYFHSIIDEPTCQRYDVDMKRLWRDLRKPGRTPQYGFITPNLCNDGHDSPCVNGDPGGLIQINRFLKRVVPRIKRSPGFRDRGLLLITFDEAEAEGEGGDASACCNEQPGPNTPNPGGPILGPGGGRIGMVALSPCLRGGRVVSSSYNHYSMLRSVEDLFGLSHIGFAGQAGLESFNAKLFKRSPCA